MDATTNKEFWRLYRKYSALYKKYGTKGLKGIDKEDLIDNDKKNLKTFIKEGNDEKFPLIGDKKYLDKIKKSDEKLRDNSKKHRKEIQDSATYNNANHNGDFEHWETLDNIKDAYNEYKESCCFSEFIDRLDAITLR